LIAIAYVIIAAVVLWFVFRPLFLDRGTLEESTRSQSRRRQLIEERERVLETIRELDFDYRMGKVEEVDYADARGRYEAQAIQAMKSIDNANGKPARSPAQSDVENQVEAEIASLRKSGKGLKCSSCGTALAPGAKFCDQCGSPVSRG
jgi:hypothetical protein